LTNLILDFGGQKDAVCAALQEVVRGRPIRILVLPKAQENELAYQAFDAGLKDALESFANGNVCSVQVHGDGASTFVGGVYGPRFAGGVLEDWSGSVEGLAIEPANFDELRSIDGLSYVALSLEESPDFDLPHVTNETFPWSDWHLVAGAVRADNGQWSIRRNPAITSAT
jgi:hypothetical protein